MSFEPVALLLLTARLVARFFARAARTRFSVRENCGRAGARSSSEISNAFPKAEN
jgi:hypothetical protein